MFSTVLVSTHFPSELCGSSAAKCSKNNELKDGTILRRAGGGGLQSQVFKMSIQNDIIIWSIQGRASGSEK